MIATVLSFGISALWYSPILFGREWLTLNHINYGNGNGNGGNGNNGDSNGNGNDNRVKNVFVLYLIQLILTLIIFIVLAFIIHSMDAFSGPEGAFIGLLTWLGFIATTYAYGLIWENRSLKLTLIDSFIVFINMLAGGAIIGAW